MEVDRISNLPDSVLSHIISFLDTDLAVRTCVLSKRWKSVYRDVPRLSFCLPCPKPDEVQETTGFEKLVSMSLLMNRCRSLDSFVLSCVLGSEKLNCFGGWLSTVMTRNVNFLDLDLLSKAPWEAQDSDLQILPSCIFTSNSLKILILYGDVLVRIPGLVSLPKLECLTLHHVKYDCEESLQKLIGGCPVLKSLFIKRDRYDGVRVFSVFSDTIERLQILASYFDLDHIGLKLEIKAPFLKYLRLCDYVSQNFSFGTLPNLVELHLFDLDDDNKDDYLNYLDIDIDDREELFYNGWVRGLVDETLDKELKILSIGIEEILDVFAGSNKVFSSVTNLIITSSTWEWKNLLQLLGKTENLKVLKLKNPCREFNGMFEAEDAPACFLSSLQRISVLSWLTRPETHDFASPDSLLGVVKMGKYFLKHGRSLHRFSISHTYTDAINLSCGRNSRRISREILSAFTQKSSNCEIHIV